MKSLFLLGIFCLTIPFQLWAKGHEQVSFAGQYSLQAHSFSKVSSEFENVSSNYGWRLDYLTEYDPELWVGVGYSRGKGTWKNTESNSEIIDGIVEKFFGDRDRVKEKGPFWDKLFYRVGGRAGLYRWTIQKKKPGLLTELNYGPTFYSFGWTVSPYVAVGLGELGSVEYAYRLHFSGGADTSTLNNSYVSYVYNLYF